MRCRKTVMLASCCLSDGIAPGDRHMLLAFPAHSMPKALARRDRCCADQSYVRGCGTEPERGNQTAYVPSDCCISRDSNMTRQTFSARVWDGKQRDNGFRLGCSTSLSCISKGFGGFYSRLWRLRTGKLSSALSPTATSIFDLSAATRYAPPVYLAYHQEAPYVTSLSDRRRRLCYSHV